MRFMLVLLVTFISACTQSITNLDMFRLGYLFTHSIGLDHVYIDPFVANVPILYPLKAPGNKRLSVFSGSIKWEQWSETA